MSKIIILQGIPCSGKSSWVSKLDDWKWKILSCDKIRMSFYPEGGKYKFDSRIEEKVWDSFYKELSKAVKEKRNIVIDNTSLKQSYINRIMSFVTPDYYSQIKTFHISLWRAQWRNIKRWIGTGKYIPFKVMKTMYKNYKKITKK